MTNLQLVTRDFLNNVTFKAGTLDDRLALFADRLQELVDSGDITLNDAYQAIGYVYCEYRI